MGEKLIPWMMDQIHGRHSKLSAGQVRRKCIIIYPSTKWRSVTNMQPKEVIISIPEIYAFPLVSPGTIQYTLPSYIRWVPELEISMLIIASINSDEH